MQAQNTLAPLSIIIPTLNEAGNITATLQNIPPAPELEIIVVDGGSEDATVELARRCGVHVLLGTRGRAKQMNMGAAVAKGEAYLFLHADTRLPVGFDGYVRGFLLKPEVVAGAFRLRIDSRSRGLRFIERMANWRSRVLQMPYGDQAIFLRAETFREVGGFPDMPLMEDFEFIKRLQGRGKIVTAPVSVLTSARRWQKLGVLRTTLVNQAILFGYRLGVPPTTLARWYHRN